jgi:hypothetical protein
MVMTQLNYSIGTGANDYVACIAAPAPPETGKSAFRMPALRVLDLKEPLPPGRVKVECPCRCAARRGGAAGRRGKRSSRRHRDRPQPDGTAFTQSTEPYDPKCVVQMENSSLIDLLVNEPQPGEWTVEVESTVAFLTELIAGGTLTLGVILAEICSWADAGAAT